MAFQAKRFSKQDINRAFNRDIRLTQGLFKQIKNYEFGDLTEHWLLSDKEDIRHLHAALRKDYKSPWREILTSVVSAALRAENPAQVTFKFAPVNQRRPPKRIEISYNEKKNQFTVNLKGPFPAPWDPPGERRRSRRVSTVK
jgi:hypothetical protein